MNPEATLQELLEEFSTGKDRSIQKAKEIEGFIAEYFPLDHPIQELADHLAQYRPSGGDFLYSEEETMPVVSKWLKSISV